MQAETISPIPVASGGRLKLVVVGAVVFLAVVYLVYTATQAGAVYYLTVSELKQRGPSTWQQVRVSGDVVDGTIQRDGTTVRFVVKDAGGQLPVVYQGVVPDIFGPNIQVVVEGKYGADGVFHASTLLAKCPSRFESATPVSGP